MATRYQSKTVAQVKRMLLQLAPDGPIWRSPNVEALFEGLAGGWQSLLDRVADALLEMWGSTASETLAQWITEWGLDTDACSTGIPSTEAEQQVLVAGRSTAQGGQSASYYTAVAAAMGIAITIDEAPYDPPRCGVARCGVDSLNGEYAAHTWRVTAPAATSADSRASLECVINRTKPAHTAVEYVYS